MTTNKPEEQVVVNFTATELADCVTLMSIVIETFNAMADVAAREENVTMLRTMHARINYTHALAKKLNDALNIGEPMSKALH